MENQSYSYIFCKVYDAFGWNYYPEIFGQQLLQWLHSSALRPKTALDLACGTGVLCEILHQNGIHTTGMDLSEGMIAIARQRNSHIHYDVADMITYRPDTRFDLVTCTGDAINHIADLADVAQIFRNVYDCLNPGGYFVFDLLDEQEVSDSQPFDMDFTDTTRVWFQMTRPAPRKVTLTIRVYEHDALQLEENIRETIHDPIHICRLLENAGFTVARCAHNLLPENSNGTTWFLIARKAP